MQPSEMTLVGVYGLVSTLAMLLVKQFVNPAIAAWKHGPGLSSAGGFVALGAVLYGISFLLWMVILARNELSLAYPLLIGLTLVATTLASWMILGESLSAPRLLGIVVIFLGVVLVTRQ